MKLFQLNPIVAVRGAFGRLLAAPLCTALLALAACSGSAVVTMTSTSSQDHFLAYRVGLVAVQLQASSGQTGLALLPARTTVDFTTLENLSEVLGAAAVSKGSYQSALVTLDFSSARIVYDDGSVNGVTLTPVGANGQALGQVQLTVTIDPSNSFNIALRGVSRLALDFDMAASNIVNLSAKTVTVTPFIAASALPIDDKPVRIRGPLESIANDNASTAASAAFTIGAMPFNGTARGEGRLTVVATDSTSFEVNGTAAIGSVGLGQLATVSTGTLAVAYGAFSTTVGTTATTSSNISFVASQILAGSSVQGAGLDRVSGVVTARSGNALGIEDATLIGADGSETFLGGTTIVTVSPNTLVTVFGKSGSQSYSPQQVSAGSMIDAFGLLSGQSAESAALDASAGRVRLEKTSASGLVNGQSSGALSLSLTYLGGRRVAAFDFVGTGAAPGQYVVNTGALDLANSTPASPVMVTGLTNSFGAATPNFTADRLLDPTTIDAELIIDWAAGTAAPFTRLDSSAIEVDAGNRGINSRHHIQIGAQDINIVGLSSDPLIVPDSTSANTLFSIGHSAGLKMESFNSYAAFVTQAQAEMSGAVAVTGVTAVGQYAASTFTLTARNITLFLND